jgi:Cep192 domain 4
MRRYLWPLALLAALAAVLLAPAAGQASRSPSLAWSPTTSAGTFDYGAVDVGQTASQDFTLTNSGGSASGALTIALSGSSAFSITSDACTATALGPNKSCALTVEYAPTTAGQTDTATLTATGKKPGTVSASITLTGSGTGTADLTLSPGTFLGTTNEPGKTKLYHYDFASNGSGTTTFTVTNNGNAASEGLHFAGCCDPHFSLANNNCESHVVAANGGTCTFDFTFTAPAGCNPGDLFATPNDIFGFSPDLLHYIHMETTAHCPL